MIATMSGVGFTLGDFQGGGREIGLEGAIVSKKDC